jgi:hypothetical protein
MSESVIKDQQEIQGTFSKVQFIQKLIKQYYSEKDSCKYIHI